MNATDIVIESKYVFEVSVRGKESLSCATTEQFAVPNHGDTAYSTRLTSTFSNVSVIF